jgi:Do/DeqQ family serine protease
MRVVLVLGVLLAPASRVMAGDKRVVQLFTDMQKEIVAISDGVKKSVVHIEVIQKSESGRPFRSLGSGVVVDPQGYVLTNEHVVGRSVSVKVIFEDKRESAAEVIGVDKQTDLALLKVETTVDLPAATFGNSDQVEVGEWVIAVGNPFGFDRTVSFGIVSGKGRVISDLPTETPLLNNFIQTDAAIDPGSSGGPLVNLRGEVIGINSIGIGRGQGFTIPSNMARDVTDRLRQAGSVERGWLGISVQPCNRRFARYYGDTTVTGVLVGDIEPGSPAEGTGLASGDVVTAFDGTPLSAENTDDLNTFILMVSNRKVGDRVNLEVFRSGERLSIPVTIGQQPKVKADEYETPFGFRAKEITFNLARALRLDSQEGVFVDFVEVGGVASEAELSEGDVIRFVEHRAIRNLEDLKTVFTEFKDKEQLLVVVQNGRVERLVLFDRAAGSDKDTTAE